MDCLAWVEKTPTVFLRLKKKKKAEKWKHVNYTRNHPVKSQTNLEVGEGFGGGV